MGAPLRIAEQTPLHPARRRAVRIPLRPALPFPVYLALRIPEGPRRPGAAFHHWLGHALSPSLRAPCARTHCTRRAPIPIPFATRTALALV